MYSKSTKKVVYSKGCHVDLPSHIVCCIYVAALVMVYTLPLRSYKNVDHTIVSQNATATATTSQNIKTDAMTIDKSDMKAVASKNEVAFLA